MVKRCKSVKHPICTDWIIFALDLGMRPERVSSSFSSADSAPRCVPVAKTTTPHPPWQLWSMSQHRTLSWNYGWDVAMVDGVCWCDGRWWLICGAFWGPKVSPTLSLQWPRHHRFASRGENRWDSPRKQDRSRSSFTTLLGAHPAENDAKPPTSQLLNKGLWTSRRGQIFSKGKFTDCGVEAHDVPAFNVHKKRHARRSYRVLHHSENGTAHRHSEFPAADKFHGRIALAKGCIMSQSFEMSWI